MLSEAYSRAQQEAGHLNPMELLGQNEQSEHLLTTPETSFSSVATSHPGENTVKTPDTTVRGCRAEDVPTCRYARAAAAARRCCFLKSRPPAARHQTSLLLEAALPGSQCLSCVLDVDVSGGRLCKRDALSGVSKQKTPRPSCGSERSVCLRLVTPQNETSQQSLFPRPPVGMIYFAFIGKILNLQMRGIGL